MNNLMGRLAFYPFSIGCNSHSSVDDVATTPNQPISRKQQGEQEESSSEVKMKMNTSSWYLDIKTRPTFSDALNKLIKTISHLFVYQQRVEKKEEEREMEMEMEIGFPTDIKHITHIGLDGTTTTTNNKVDGCRQKTEVISLPPTSITNFEAAMAAQAHAPRKQFN